jgi:predicted RNA-binding Zn ribbon-like protein
MSNGSLARVWMLPDEPVSIRLMSTIWADTEGIHDDLLTPNDLDEWLDAAGIDRLGARATVDELAAARALRDAARRLAAHVTEDIRAKAASPMTDLGEAIGRVNAAASRSTPAALTLHDGRLVLGAAPGGSPVTVGLAQVAEESIQTLAGESAVALRACQAPGCVLYFVRSHPRREWCSVACGNRARAARHYERTRAHR